MNRDIKDIVCVDFDDQKFSFHTRNVVKIPKWEGDDSDRALIDLIPFLEHLAQPQLDVRLELDKYGHEKTGEKFTEVQIAYKDMIMKQREKGFGGIYDKMNASGKPISMRMNPDMNFSSKFKNE